MSDDTPIPGNYRYNKEESTKISSDFRKSDMGSNGMKKAATRLESELNRHSDVVRDETSIDDDSRLHRASSLAEEPCNNCIPADRYIDLKDADNIDADDIFAVSAGVRKGLMGNITLNSNRITMVNKSVEEAEKKFLIFPSFMAGVCLGTNNFFLSYIAYLGLPAALIFSLGALVGCLIWKIFFAIKAKSSGGEFFPTETSNMLKLDIKKNARVCNCVNFIGLCLRTAINISFQFFIILAFKYAVLA